MAHPTFLRKILQTGQVERLPFTAEHFSAVGFKPMMSAGLPTLEAHQLVNKWNVSQHEQRFVYALE